MTKTEKTPRTVVTDPRIVRLRAARDAGRRRLAAIAALERAQTRANEARALCETVIDSATSTPEKQVLSEVMGL